LSLVVLLAAPAVVLNASPCSACSCVPQTPKRLLRDADAAFVGTVIDEQAIDPVTTVQTFDVEGVFKGTLGPTVQVIAPIGPGGGNTCGVLYARDTRVAVILHRQGDGWTSDLCSFVELSDLEKVASSPVAPRAEPSGSGSPTPVAPASSGSGHGLGWGTAVLGLLLAVAVIALALSLGGRRERGRGTSPLEAAEQPEHGPPADPPGSSG
jgi:hypothetical protein